MPSQVQGGALVVDVNPTVTRTGAVITAITAKGTTYATDPGPSQAAYDRKYTALELANGTRFTTVDYYEGDSECKATINKVLEDTDATLLTLCGFGATVGVPAGTTVIAYHLPDYTRVVDVCTCSMAELTFEHGKPVMLNAEFLATSPPVDIASPSGTAAYPPSITNGNFLYWKDLLTLSSKAGSGVKGRKFSVKLEHNLDAFYGVRADGLALPTTLTATEAVVTGSLEKLLIGDADYLLYLAACQAVADVGLTAQSFCGGGSSPTLTVTAKNTIYENPSRSGAVKQAFYETFGFRSKTAGGANPLVVTLA